MDSLSHKSIKWLLNFFPSGCAYATTNKGHSFRQWPGLPQLKHVLRFWGVPPTNGPIFLVPPTDVEKRDVWFPDGKANELCNGETLVLPTALVDLNDQERALAALEARVSASFLWPSFSAFFIFLASWSLSASSLSRYLPTVFQPYSHLSAIRMSFWRWWISSIPSFSLAMHASCFPLVAASLASLTTDFTSVFILLFVSFLFECMWFRKADLF